MHMQEVIPTKVLEYAAGTDRPVPLAEQSPSPYPCTCNGPIDCGVLHTQPELRSYAHHGRDFMSWPQSQQSQCVSGTNDLGALPHEAPPRTTSAGVATQRRTLEPPSVVRHGKCVSPLEQMPAQVHPRPVIQPYCITAWFDIYSVNWRCIMRPEYR